MNIEVALNTINGREVPAVTSLQVAEAFGKEHRNVLADIRNVSSKCSESFNALSFQLANYKDAKGETRPMYLLSKDGLMMLTMGYGTPEAMRVKEAFIARFNEMEERLRGPQLPDFRNPALAARAWAEEYERRQVAEQQRDEALRTKAQIGSRREATAMSTAARFAKENASLKNAIGRGKTWKQVRAIEWLPHYFRISHALWAQVGKKLTALSSELGRIVRRHYTSDYPEGVGLYHADVIAEFRRRLDTHPDMLHKYRLVPGERHNVPAPSAPVGHPGRP